MDDPDAFDQAMLDLIDFRDERNWQQFHTPRNLFIALAGEVGELGSLFQWTKDEEVSHWISEPGNYQKVSEEIGDVLAYLILLSESFGIRPLEALREKMEINREKYPVEKAFGNSKKYDEFPKDDDSGVVEW